MMQRYVLREHISEYQMVATLIKKNAYPVEKSLLKNDGGCQTL